MRHSPHATDQQNSSRAPIAARDGETTRAISRRLHRSIGFWLGGIILGVPGCLLGASMPYHHPVGVVVSVFWWGLYLGCFGMSLGALVGLWAAQDRGFASPGWDGAGEPSAAANSLIARADGSGIINGASRAAGGGLGLPATSRSARLPRR
jgi:hypothetical protein